MSQPRTLKGVSSATRLDNGEIEMKRELGEWKKVLELLEACKGKVGSSGDCLINFLVAEAKLESWLEDHQPTEKHMSNAKAALSDVKKNILHALNQSGSSSGIATDARILLAKINFSAGLYEEALDELEKSRFEELDPSTGYESTVRNCQLMAEANAIKAFCMEKVGRSWKGTKNLSEADRKEEVLQRYLRATDLAVTYFQGQEKLVLNSQSNTAVSVPVPTGPVTGSTSNIPTSQSPHPTASVEKKRASSLLDHAIRRGPTILIDAGRITEAANFIHSIIRTQETQLFAPIRLMLYRRLAELLLRSKWENGTPKKLVSRSYTGAKLFAPANSWEDLFLVLLLSEVMVVRDGVLNQSPEFKKARQLANLNAAAVFDLLALSFGRWGQWNILIESLEKALKFSFEETHIWAQYGLAFHAMGNPSRKSIATIQEAIRLSKRPTSLLLLKAQEEFRRGWAEEGLKTVEIAKGGGKHKLMQKVWLYEGIGEFLMSFSQPSNQMRLERLSNSLNALQKAADLDPLDYLVLHWQARVCATQHDVEAALTYAVKALKAYPFHLPTLELIILLLSAQKNYADALSVVEEALDEYPDHLGLLQIRASLEDKYIGPEAALPTIKSMLMIWKHLFEDTNLLRSETPESKYNAHLQFPSPTDRESVSIASFRVAPSIAGSSSNTANLTASGYRADAALSEIASSISIRQGSPFHTNAWTDLAWTAQLNIWITLANLYLKMGQTSQAVLSIEEAAQIFGAHPEVLYLRGQVFEFNEEYGDARVAYESAVAVEPTHVKSLQSLALMQHYFGSHRLAEKTLQDALRIDPYDQHTWYNLGKVFETLGECSEAVNCLSKALDMEATSPTLGYSVVPICFE